MTIAYWCVFVSFLLPYVWILCAKIKAPGMNNHTPRLALDKLTGSKQRAHWAQLNAFEAFAPFAAAVIIAQQLHADQGNINLLALVYVCARIGHGIFYILDWAALRSLSWLAGFICVISLFCIS